VAKLVLVEDPEHEAERRLHRVERLHVHVQVRSEVARLREQRAKAHGGVVGAQLRRLRPQGGRERGHLYREVRLRAARPGGHRPGQRLERVGAAGGVAVRLGRRDGRLAEQVDRRENAVRVKGAECLQRALRGLADDEPVRHVPDARGGGRAEGLPAGTRVRGPHRGAERRRALVDLGQVLAEVTREVVERAARRRHVHEPE
jgi:hypothetical protein